LMPTRHTHSILRSATSASRMRRTPSATAISSPALKSPAKGLGWSAGRVLRTAPI
jgi:hypothetical protein